MQVVSSSRQTSKKGRKINGSIKKFLENSKNVQTQKSDRQTERPTKTDGKMKKGSSDGWIFLSFSVR